MDKFDICPGVYMVNIDEVDLRILCGCPMDVVKLLRRKGVIRTEYKDEVPFETGPNAILLSDAATQNGQFCNLIEFPVLHMQYKQGMSLPNHPNNDGSRPLIMGLPSQVNAQCNYFIRGKYGLISVQELMEAGFSEEDAIDMMRLKMSFNYGKLTTIEEQLGLHYLNEKESVEIRDGLSIKALEYNVYELRYKEEAVQVNLNLSPQEFYETPYKLDYHRPNAAYFSVTHLGEGNGWDINRAGMSSLVCYQGRYFLVDAPAGVESLLNAAGISINELEGIFHTHSHDDHFAGLTSLIRSDRRLKYFATKAVRYAVTKKLSAVLSVDESMFFRMFDCYDLLFDKWNDIDGLEVMPLFSPHPVETSIFYFRTLWHNNYKTYGHLADICSDRVLKEFVTEESSASGFSPERYERVKQAYLAPCELKKIDADGGLIHGDAIDFQDDTSAKIVISHIERPLSAVEKEFGTSATFGLTDVLIPAAIDLDTQRAEKWLRKAFPWAREKDITMLLNGSILHLSAGTILIKNQQQPKSIYLMLTGIVSGSSAEHGTSITLDVGSLISASSVLFAKSSNMVFRAESYVTLLEIPQNIYVSLIQDNKVFSQVRKQQRYINYLQTLPLFGNSVGENTLRYISQNTQAYKVKAGGQIMVEQNLGLHIVFSGTIGAFEQDEMKELFVDGDILGGEEIITGIQSQQHYHKAVQDALVYHIPKAVINHIPALLWELMELQHVRRRRSSF